MECVIAVLKEQPQGTELMVAGYFNADLVQPEGDRRDENIAAVLAAVDLEGMSAHFLPQRCH